MGMLFVGTSNQLFKRFLNWNKIKKKNKAVTGKTSFLVIVHFVLTILFDQTMPSDVAALYENDVFSILVLSTKKAFSSFFEKGFRFPENLFQS